MIPGSGRNPINLIAASDVAHYVVLALTQPELRDRVLEIGGWDNRTKDDIARTYAEAANRRVHVLHLPRPALRAMAGILGRVRPGTADALRLLYFVDTTDQTLDPTSVHSEFPFDLVRLDDFIRDDVTRSMKVATPDRSPRSQNG